MMHRTSTKTKYSYGYQLRRYPCNIFSREKSVTFWRVSLLRFALKDSPPRHLTTNTTVPEAPCQSATIQTESRPLLYPLGVIFFSQRIRRLSSRPSFHLGILHLPVVPISRAWSHTSCQTGFIMFGRTKFWDLHKGVGSAPNIIIMST